MNVRHPDSHPVQDGKYRRRYRRVAVPCAHRSSGIFGIILLSAWLVAACGGGGQNRGTGTIQVDIRPLVQQMAGSGGGSNTASASFTPVQGGPLAPESITGPGTSIATTPVQSLIVGAIAIGFQDTPIGPDTAITDALKDNLKNAAINSVKFLSIVQLPAASPFAEFEVPPPGAIHWQIVVIGTRNAIQVLSDLTETSPIYYGFNTDANGNGVFLSAETVGNVPIDILVQRACFVSSPPLGCAQYTSATTAVVTGGVEIISIKGILAGGGTSIELGPTLASPWSVRPAAAAGACAGGSACTPAMAQTAMQSISLAGYIGVVVQTTHQRNPLESSACTGNSSDTTATPADNTALANCEVQSYTTIF